MKEVTLRYSEPLVREAVRAFAKRAVVRGFGVLGFVFIVVLIVGVGYLIYQGDRSWFVGVFGATLLFVGLSIGFVYVAIVRNTVGRFRQMRVPEATLSCADDSFTVTSELGSVTMPWSSITEVWRRPRFWLLLFSHSQFITLPLDCLDAEILAFITLKTEQNDGGGSET
jgi:hypothetical protein